MPGSVIRTLSELIRSQNKKLIIAPEETFQLELLINAVKFLKNTFIVIDEAQTISKPGFLPDALKDMVMVGRHRNLYYCVASRRPAEISRDFTSQVDKIYFFRLTEPNDLKYVANYYDAAKIKALTGHNYIEVDI